jgi:hypothetical protein
MAALGSARQGSKAKHKNLPLSTSLISSFYLEMATLTSWLRREIHSGTLLSVASGGSEKLAPVCQVYSPPFDVSFRRTEPWPTVPGGGLCIAIVLEMSLPREAIISLPEALQLGLEKQ